MKHLLTYIIMIMASATVARGQYYTSGDDPHDMRLMQMKGGAYRIIYDQQMQGWAERLAAKMDSVVATTTLLDGHSPRRIDVMLHSRNAYNNGMVSWAPTRMELYTFGQTDGDCVPWMYHLISHEYKHAVETSMLNQGFTRFLYVLLGEQAVGAVLGIYMPLWALEGDAVANETVLTGGGRGRQASFIKGTRTMVMEGNTPSYDQAYNGSYKIYVPDYYKMGYLTVSHAKVKYGYDVWTNAVRKVGRTSFSLTPFNRSLRHDTGNRKVALYKEAMKEWGERWAREDSTIEETPRTMVKEADFDHSEYTAKALTKNGIVAYRTTPERLPDIRDAKGNKIITPTIRTEDNIAAHDDIIVWCERRMHPRWDNASESQLMACDSEGKNPRTLLKGGKYSTPSISADGERIALVETMLDGSQRIITMGIESGEVKEELKLGRGEEATATTWTGDDEVAYISLTGDGKAIKTTKGRTLKRAQYENIRHLTSKDGEIYYTSDKTGVDNIYHLGGNGEGERITSAKYGASWPLVKGDEIIYSEYGPKGYSIVSTPINTRATDNPTSEMREVADMLTKQTLERIEERGGVKVETEGIEPKRYRRIWHLFGLHSWGPVVTDAEENTVSPGISIASQNTLGTSILAAGMKWGTDTEEKYFIKYTYSGLWPKIDISHTWGYYDYKYYGMTMKSDTELTIYEYDDRQKIRRLKTRLYLPLIFNHGTFVSGIEPSVMLEKNTLSDITVSKTEVSMKPIDNMPVFGPVENNTEMTKTEMKAFGTEYGTLRYDLTAYIAKRRAERDLGTRLGISADIGMMHTPIGDDCGENKFAIADIYLPGIGRHHYISLSMQYQKKSAGEKATSIEGNEYDLLLGDIVGTARGTERLRNDKAMLMRMNYAMPLFCPDWSIGPICYIKRVNMRLFMDIEKVSYKPYMAQNAMDVTRKSVGTDIWMESHWLRLPYQVNLGVRCLKVIDGSWNNEMLMSVSMK